MDETTDGRGDDESPGESYSLGELAGAAEVSTRTIRYYISEGLLPPPVGAGHASRYTGGHLARLRRIAALKAQYLPLREIRNRLGDPATPAPHAPDEPDDPAASRSSARDYLRGLRRASAGPSHLLHEHDAGAAYAFQPPPTASPMMSPILPAPPPAAEEPEATADAPPPDVLAMDRSPPERVWRRIPLGDSAELVIADDLYRRRRDKVDWLVRWARKVLAG